MKNSTWSLLCVFITNIMALVVSIKGETIPAMFLIVCMSIFMSGMFICKAIESNGAKEQ